MALIVDLKVNSDQIDRLVIHRLSPSDSEIAYDTVCRYEWEFQGGASLLWKHRGELEHRYWDGAWVLVAKVLAAAGVRGGGQDGGVPEDPGTVPTGH